MGQPSGETRLGDKLFSSESTFAANGVTYKGRSYYLANKYAFYVRIMKHAITGDFFEEWKKSLPKLTSKI